MSECKFCPHVVGDATERDCCFPDCVGGWDKIFNIVCLERDKYRKALEEILKSAEYPDSLLLHRIYEIAERALDDE